MALLKQSTAKEPPKPYLYKPYPRWVHSKVEDKRRVVQNAQDETYHTGVPMNEDGTPFVDDESPSDPPTPPPPTPLSQRPTPTPPTLETVIAAGYAREAAEKIVAEEQRKAAAGEKPYGDKPTTPPREDW